jgi:hypothetical protein
VLEVTLGHVSSYYTLDMPSYAVYTVAAVLDISVLNLCIDAATCLRIITYSNPASAFHSIALIIFDQYKLAVAVYTTAQCTDTLY